MDESIGQKHTARSKAYGKEEDGQEQAKRGPVRGTLGPGCKRTQGQGAMERWILQQASPGGKYGLIKYNN